MAKRVEDVLNKSSKNKQYGIKVSLFHLELSNNYFSHFARKMKYLAPE